MKKILFIALFALAAAGQAKIYKTIKNPVALGSVNIYEGGLIARKVVMADTATTIHFTIEYPKGNNFRFDKGSYLVDEKGNHYPLRSAEGLKLNSWVKSPESGMMDFTMHFEPMPKGVKIFDFTEGNFDDAFMLLGIHDKKYKIKAPTLEQISQEYPYTLPDNWFRTDTITIKGRIEGYDAEKFGFTSMRSYYRDQFVKDNGAMLMDIAPDGTFERKFVASYPIRDGFYADDTKVDFDQIPYYACPGETIDITVRKNENGQYECYYNNGSSKEVERWLKSNIKPRWIMRGLARFEGKFAEAKQIADDVWNKVIYYTYTAGRREHFTPMEMQLALAEAQTEYACDFMDYVMHSEDNLKKYEMRDSVYHMEILDEKEWNELLNPQNYAAIQRIDFDNPLLLTCSTNYFTLNRIQYTVLVMDRKYLNTYNMNAVEREKRTITNALEALRDLMATDKDNIMAQLCIYDDILNNFNFWRKNEEAVSKILADTTMTASEREKHLAYHKLPSDMMPVYLDALTHPYIHKKAEQFYAAQMEKKDLTTVLPKDNKAADLIRSISAKYPGRYLMIDFWGMGCGPCRGEIERSKDSRAEIAKRDDVKLIFIAGERTAEGSEAYHNYVNKWLDGEETICVSNSDFNRFEELFKFSGIPHKEFITPDCRRICENFHDTSYQNLGENLKEIKKKLE